MRAEKIRGKLPKVATVIVYIMCFGLGVAYAQEVPDLNSWVGTWFKTPLIRNVFHFSDIGVLPTPPYGYQTVFPAYLKIISWDSVDQVLQGNLYVADRYGAFDPTRFTTTSLRYFAGTDLKFVCMGEVITATQRTGLTMFFKGVKNKSGNFVLGGNTSVTTLGAYHLELDYEPGSMERWAGSAKLAGNMIPLSKVPPVLLVP